MPLQYYMSWTQFRDELLPISRRVFDTGWKVEIVGNVGSTRGYLEESHLFGLQRDEMGISRLWEALTRKTRVKQKTVDCPSS